MLRRIVRFASIIVLSFALSLAVLNLKLFILVQTPYVQFYSDGGAVTFWASFSAPFWPWHCHASVQPLEFGGFLTPLQFMTNPFNHHWMLMVPWWMILTVVGAGTALVFRLTRKRRKGAPAFPVQAPIGWKDDGTVYSASRWRTMVKWCSAWPAMT